MINKKVPKFGQKEGKKWCSAVMMCSWVLILMWTAFLVYCWRSGLVDQAKIKQIVEKVDGMIEGGNLRKNSDVGNVVRAPGTGDNQVPDTADLVATDDAPEDGAMHVVFSTDCSGYQNWQTLLLFHSAKKVGQKGRITRIASGCDEKQQAELTALYAKLYPQYGAHFTPDFKKDEKTKKKYDFYNKPWGMKHWLENAVPAIPPNTIIALLDPDMIFVRPLTTQIRGDISLLTDRGIKDEEIVDTIGLGHPVSQTYGLGAPWTNDNHKKFNRGKICQEGSPCLEVAMRFGELHYAVGPPYIAHKSDFIRIVKSWTSFVPRVYEGYPYLLAEMYAYSMAAAHERLPHLQVDNYMVSSSDAGGEAWPHVDSLPEVCVPPDEDGHFYPGMPMTTVIHYCQSYRAGDLGFQKRRVPHDIFSCESPMLVVPPADLAASTYKMKSGKKMDIKNAREAKRHAFVLCVIYSAFNDALLDFKQRMCPDSSSTNYAKTINING